MQIRYRKIIKYLLIGVCGIVLLYKSPFWMEKYPFIESDFEWINQFSDGDRLIYYSEDLCEYDTICIYDVRISGPKDSCPLHWEKLNVLLWFEIGTGPLNSYYGGNMELHHRNLIDTDFGYFSMRRKDDSGPLHFTFKLGKYMYKSNNPEMVLDSVTFNQQHRPIHTINESTSEYLPRWSRYNQIVSEVIWSKPYGIIEYTLTTGEKYRLVEYRHADGRVEKFDQE